MKRAIYLTGVIIFIILQSCYKDLGNYDYLDYNKIESVYDNGLLTKRTVVFGDTIRIVPEIRWKYPERDITSTAFEYQWELNDSVISTERNLEYIPEKIMHYAPCNLYITEKQTGIITVYRGFVTVNTPFNAGWVLLSEKEGRSALSYIRRDTKIDENWYYYYDYAEYKDIYNTLFPRESLGENPKRLFNVFIDEGVDEILVLQQPDQCVFLSGDDFSKTIYLKDEFQGGEYPAGFVPKDFIDGGQCTYLAGENGDVYWKISPWYYGKLHLVRFIPVPLYHPGDISIGFFPGIRVLTLNMAHMYDELNNRILACHTTFNTQGDQRMGSFIEFINNEKPDDMADINNLGEYKMIYMGGENPNFMMILKREDTGDYFYHSYRINGVAWFLNVKIINHSQEVFAGNSLVSGNSVFMQLRRSSYLFFSEGSKLYFYDRATGRVKLYHDFGTGNIVKIMSDPPGTEIGVALDDGNFYICSTSIHYLAANNPGAEGGILHHTSGLGKIKDLIWKYGGYDYYRFNRYP